MLIGEYRHSIDQKGRLIMPSKFRDDLGDSFIVCKGLDNCLFVLSNYEFETFKNRIKEMPFTKARDFQRYFFSSAHEVELDKMGRILIPAHLREFASLEKDAVVVGASSRAEIWSPDLWDEQIGSLTSERIAATMEEIGF